MDLPLKQTDRQKTLVVAKGEMGRGGMDWVFGISRCKPLNTEWINKKVLLYNTGNSTVLKNREAWHATAHGIPKSQT